MKIRTQLIIGLTVFALLLLAVSVLVATTADEVGRLDRQREAVNTLAFEVGELGYLTNDYTLYLEPQQAARWREKYDEIEGSLKGLAPETPEQLAIVDNLKASLANVRLVFDDVSGTASSSASPSLAMVQLSWSRMTVQTQGMAFDARRLSDLLEAEATHLRTENNLLILSLMGLFSGLLLTSYFLFYRRTLSSLSILQGGTEIIGAGNLGHTIAGTSDDEVGDLAQAFNRMTASLRSVTASKADLEKEMEVRRLAEAALRESEERLRSLYETMTEGFASHEVVYEDGKAVDYLITGVNPAFERITGIPRAGAVGARASELYQTGKPPFLEVYARVASGAGPEHFETFFPPMKQHFSVSAFSPGKGKFATVFTDITDRKKAEEKIAHLASFPELNPSPVLEVNPAGEVVYANPAASQALGRLGLGENPAAFLPGDFGFLLPRLMEGDVEEEVAVGERAYLVTLTLNPSTRTTRIYARDITERKKAEEGLRESEEKFRVLAVNTPDHILVQDRDLRYVQVINPQLGLTVEEMIGKTDYDILSKEDADHLTRIKRRVLETGTSDLMSIPLADREGNTQYFEGQYVQKLDTAGRVDGILGYFRNVSDRRHAEQVLRETSQYLENLINYANAPIIVWDRELRITRFNHAFERLTGRTAGEVMGKSLEILFPPETMSDSMEHIARTMAGERWETVEIPVVHEDGSIRTVLWNSAPLFEADGKTISSAIAQGQDITDRKQMEEELHHTSQYLENLINYANAPIIVWDPEFRITRFNHAFEHLTGRTAGEVTGQRLEILFPPDTAAPSMDIIMKAMAGERWEVVEIPILHRDGNVREVLWNSATLYEADGTTVSSAIAQGQDITEQKRMMEEIARKANELSEANAELSAEVSQRKKAEETAGRALSVLHAALESTADAMLVVDRSGKITSRNENFTTMWNIPDSVLQTLDTRAAIDSMASQLNDPDGFSARMQEILDHPQRESYDMLELLDGRIIERYSKPQRIGTSTVGRVFSFRDVTDRKRGELQLIESLDEKEVLLREIHHRVKNNLQLTTSLLDMTRMRTRDPEASGVLTDIMMKIQTMAQIHTRLYESKQFDRINMDRQIRDQIQALT
ncbi:MAG: PAS domain S-box protein, partial [Methanomicrobiales archaeon]